MKRFKVLYPLLNALRQRVLLFSFFFIALVYAAFIYFAIHPKLPSAQNPLIFYSNQTRDDIKLIFAQALKNAQHSIHLTMYALTDPDIIALLRAKHQQGLSVRIFYDPSATSHQLMRTTQLPAYPINSSSLMHRKIAVLDHSLVFLGSANMTTPSLTLHDNLVFGIYHPELAHFLQHSTSSHFPFTIENQHGNLWLLPESNQEALQAVLTAIQRAQKTIRIAMFTLTHPTILDALLSAKMRGVDISIAVDYFTGHGASAEMIESLQKAGISVLLSMGRELLHYKWALIDGETLLFGSTNWTKAGFAKNYDFLLRLHPLTTAQQKYLTQLWAIIRAESH